MVYRNIHRQHVIRRLGFSFLYTQIFKSIFCPKYKQEKKKVMKYVFSVVQCSSVYLVKQRVLKVCETKVDGVSGGLNIRS